MKILVLILLSPATMLVLFIVTLVGQFACRGAAAKGDFAKARLFGTLAFMGATLIVVHEVASLLFFRSAMAALMIALWSWIAWRDYKFLKSLPQPR